ncbi:MAG: acyltransferase family protein [Clostridia bacterium]|jgi:peptidoglycan/LPS O-acetylase OafA/YrhL
MQILKTKKQIMAVAAILIAVYHLWIPVFSIDGLHGRIEHFFVSIGYIGVDLFFFLSAYTLSKYSIASRWKFIVKRLSKIYPVFLLFCISALLIGKLSFKKFLATAFFWDFIKQGGGSFLWFIPAIILMYITFPYFKSALSNYSPFKRLAISLSVWIALSFAIEYGLRGIADISIFLMRIPVILLGMFLAEYEGLWSIKRRLVTGVLLFLPGIVLVYQFGYLNKLRAPFDGMFYIIALPCVLGLIFLLDAALQSSSFKFADMIGNATLELYCIQMLIGSELVSAIFKLTKIKILTNFITFAIVILFSIALSYVRKYIANRKAILYPEK